MSSLRLAIQQSLQEATGDGSDSAPKREKKKRRISSSSATKRPPRKPGDPPRKRGRPRKHPLPEPPPEEKEEEKQEDASSSENEFDSGHEESESESESERDDEEEHDSEDEEEDDSDHERHQHKKTMKRRNSAANTIQNKWKQKKNKSSKDDGDDRKEKASSKKSDKKKKSSKSQTVQPPEPELMEWMQNLSNKKMRRNICAGLRVKVRFETKVRKRDGKIVRKPKWYGGLITAVSTGGSKIRIKYDDGTSEVTKFPDEDIIVDAEGNGRHRESASAFEMPEPDAEEAEEEEQKDEARVSEGKKEGKPAEGKPKKTTESASKESDDSKDDSVTEKVSRKKMRRKKKKKSLKTKETAGNESDDEGKGADRKPADSAAKEKKQQDQLEKSSSSKEKPKLKLPLVAPKRKRETTIDDRSRESGDDDKPDEGEQHPEDSTAEPETPSVPSEFASSSLGMKRGRDEEPGGVEEEPPTKKIDTTLAPESGPPSAAEPLKESELPVDEQAAATEPEKDEPGTEDVEIKENEEEVTAQEEPAAKATEDKRAPAEDTSVSAPEPAEEAKATEEGKATEDDTKEASPMETEELESAPPVAKSAADEENSPDEDAEKAVSLKPSANSAFEKKAASSNEKPPEKEPVKVVASERKVSTPVPDFSGFVEEPYSPVPRSGRRAAQQANERIAARQEIVIQDPYAKKKKKREKPERSSSTGEGKRKRSADDDSEEDEGVWVQCDKCKKWRVLPSSVQTETLPELWYCEMNIYDALRNTCDATEQTQAEIRRERKKAKKKAARLARKQAEQLASGLSEADLVPKKGKKERAKARQSVRSPANDKSAQAGSRSQTPVSDTEVEPRKAFTKQSSFTSSSGRKSKNGDEEAEFDGTTDSAVKRGRGRGRRARASQDFGIKGVGGRAAIDDPDNQEWVMCEKCSKWRRLPPHVSADTLPEVWYCSMNTWNRASASCQAPEDKAEPGTLEFGIYGSGVSTAASGNKLSYRNLIFGTAGKKQNRPLSERTRAAESLFAPPDDPSAEDVHLKVMYANSSMYMPRGVKSATGEEPSRISLFDIMDRSKLWAELRNASIMQDALTKPVPAMYQSRTIDNSFGSFLPETRQALKDIVCHSLGERTLAGHEVLLEAQCRPWNGAPSIWSEVRPYCTVHNVVEALLELASEGRVEIVQPDAGAMLSPLPKYRRIPTKDTSATIGSPPDNATESPRNSRCIKIAKPWKQGQDLQLS